MNFNRIRKRNRLLVTAAVLACMLTACSFGRGKESPSQSGQQAQAASQVQNSGSQTAGSALPEDSILNFQKNKEFARLQSDMKNGDIPIECNVLYDEDGARPDVTVTDKEKIREIYDQLADITVGDKSSEKVAGSFHHITFRLRNDTYVTFNFEGEKLFCWGMDNYTVSGGNNLWNTVRSLQMPVMNSREQAKQTTARNGQTGQTGQASTAKTASSSDKNSDKDSTKEKEAEKTGLAGKKAPESKKEVELASSQSGSPSITGDKAETESALKSEAAANTKKAASEGITPEKDSSKDTGKKTAADKKPSADPESAESADTKKTAEPGEGADTQKTAEPAEAQTVPGEDPSDSSTAGTAASAEAAEEIADPGLDPAMAEAYTDIVRAYAKVFSIDKDQFMEAYSQGLYSKEAPNPDLAPDFDERINYDLYLDLYTGTLEGDAVYGLHDYNKDGIQELVIAVADGDNKTLRAMYTFDGKKAVSLFTGSLTPAYRVDVFSLPEEEFLVHMSGGAASGGDAICRIAEDASGLKVIAEYEYDASKTGNLDHISETGEVLTEEDFYKKYGDTANPADGLSLEKVSGDASVSLKAAE